MPTSGNDTIILQPSTLVDGLAGVDQLIWEAGSGSSTVSGGTGGENYDTNVYGPAAQGALSAGGDRLIFNTDQGVNIQMSRNSANGVATVAGQTVNFTDIERIFTGAGNDTIRAGSVNSGDEPMSIYTGAGNDYIGGSNFGTTGSGLGDIIDPGEGNDTVYAGAGDDFIQASRGDDLIYGGAGNDNIRWGQGTPGGNSGTGGAEYGNDTIYGGDGSDVVNLWANQWDDHDTLPGGAGVDVTIQHIRADGAMRGIGTVDFDGPRQTVNFQGIEQVWTHEGRDTFDASAATREGSAGVAYNGRWGNDVMVGSSGNDRLEGGDDSDVITGGAGNDQLIGGGDFYNVNGGQDGAADTFIFAAGHGQDTIQGFELGLDALDLGGRTYVATDSSAGMVLSNGADSILIIGVHDDFGF